jgi:hypothetical protein
MGSNFFVSFEAINIRTYGASELFRFTSSINSSRRSFHFKLTNLKINQQSWKQNEWQQRAFKLEKVQAQVLRDWSATVRLADLPAASVDACPPVTAPGA